MRFIQKTVPLLGVAALAAAVPQMAQAQSKLITLTGELAYVGSFEGVFPDKPSAYDSTVQVGTPFTYSFLVDDSEPKTFPITAGNFELADYNTTGPTYGATVKYGDVTFTPDATSVNKVAVSAGLGASKGLFSVDQFSQYGIATGLINGYVPISEIAGTASDTKIDPPVDINDPVGVLTNSNSPGNFFFYNLVEANNGQLGYEVYGTADKVTITDVPASVAPEPSSVATVGIVGLVTAGLMLKARKRRAGAAV